MHWLLLFLSVMGQVGADQGVTVWPIQSAESYAEDWSSPTPRWRDVYGETMASDYEFLTLLPAQTSLVLRCDPNASALSDSLAPDYGLTPDALDAVAAAPRWLRADLTDNLRQLSEGQQNTLADMILNPADPLLRDEIAFQAANICPQQLARMNLDIIACNLDSLFAIDEELDYVEIIDYGNPSADDDYYSTVRYTAVNDSDEVVEFEIPSEIYYWYIIHPRGTDELPKIIYEKFWREYLYYDNGTVSYTENPEGDPYPLLRDELDTVTVAWGGEGNGAVGAVHRWVSGVMHWGATPPRPIQPNEIATDHDGNCGEYQDIKWAGGRTALLPYVGVLDINEDHVWCATWRPYDYDDPEEGSWYAAQESAYDKDQGGSKYCSCIWQWRGDGYQYSVIENYSNSCTLTVDLYAPDGKPVDNAAVEIQSEGWKTIMRIKGFSGVTDRNGRFTTTLGEEQNYYIRAWWEDAEDIDSASALAGAHFYRSCTLSSDYQKKARNIDFETWQHFSIEGEIDTTIPIPFDDVCYVVLFNNHPDLGEIVSGTISVAGSDLHLSVNAACDVANCPTYSYEEVASRSRVKYAPGLLTDFFITDYQGVLTLGSAESPPLTSLPLELEIPALIGNDGTPFRIANCPGPVSVSVFDKLGRRVYETQALPDPSGMASVYWQGRTQPSGVYFVQVESGTQQKVAKTILLR